MFELGIATRHEPAVRQLTVTRVKKLSPNFTRVTLGGDELTGFTSDGPTDHSKLFFPDPGTGTITAPSIVDGVMHRPGAGTIIARDYTPRRFQPATDAAAAELDVDFFLHGADGPGSAWAATASAGDPLVVAGPRGSRMPPVGVARVILAADESALPALARWIELLPESVEVFAFASLRNESDAAYLEPPHVNRARLVWLEAGAAALERAVRAVGPIGDDTYVWAAGEAASLIQVRRYLRRELGLPAHQVKVDGYWKLGEEGRDHHAPIDPADPED